MHNTKNKNFTRTLIIMIVIAGLLTLGMMVLEQVRKNNDTYVTIDLDSMELVQLDGVKNGDPIAIIETTLGEIRFVLYPEYSPEAVANFTELADSGYYDGTYFYNSESGVYSSAGSKQKDGSYPKGDKHERIERELNQNLWSFKGAVCCASTDFDRNFSEMLLGGGTHYCGSRLNFLNTIEFTDELKEQLRASDTSEELVEAFIENGGIPNFSQQMTVIGQVYQGLDVVEKLASLESTDNGYYKIPDEDIMIISAKTDVYSDKEKIE
ncbi:MAG: peptidylprolyl isomerase [Ruminococcus sp.]|nr:peptidylprolyl isomerase [Ruminococcus sp.]